jgi:hypothetical protein
MTTKSQHTTISDRTKETIELVRLFNDFYSRFFAVSDAFNKTPLITLHNEVYENACATKDSLNSLLSESVCEDGRTDNN